MDAVTKPFTMLAAFVAYVFAFLVMCMLSAIGFVIHMAPVALGLFLFYKAGQWLF